MMNTKIMHTKIINEMIKNRETCRHFIDYEIYDYLTDELKQKYFKQFEIPNFYFNPDKNKASAMCKANHFDSPNLCRCDCSENYPITMSNLMDIYEQFRENLKVDKDHGIR